jgi:hypothetical protein
LPPTAGGCWVRRPSAQPEAAPPPSVASIAPAAAQPR